MDVALQKLAENGLLGILLAVSIYAIVRLFRLYTETQEKRIVENRELQEIIRQNIVSTDNNTAAIKALGELVRDRPTR